MFGSRVASQKTAADALQRLRNNVRQASWGAFVTPAKDQYAHQWLWDAGFHSIVAAKLGDLDLAKSELKTILDSQWPGGMVPHIHFDPDPALLKQYVPQWESWGTGRPTSGITQPPVLATALKTMMEQGLPQDEILPFYNKIKDYHIWMSQARVAEVPKPGGGKAALAFIVHPWESGNDNSPLYDGVRNRLLWSPFTRYQFNTPPERADKKNVDSSERPHMGDYHMYWGLIDTFKKMNYNQLFMAQDSPFRVADPLFNSIWVRANKDLADVAEALGKTEDAQRFRCMAQEVADGMNDVMWDDKAKFYWAQDLNGGWVGEFTKRLGQPVTPVPIKIKTIGGLVSLFGGIPNKQQAEALVVDHLSRTDEFMSERGVRSTSADEPAYEPKRYWRGPIWINIHWLLADGLRQYGHHWLADDLAQKSLDLVSKYGYREYYNPDKDEANGAHDFAWSTLAHVMKPQTAP